MDAVRIQVQRNLFENDCLNSRSECAGLLEIARVVRMLVVGGLYNDRVVLVRERYVQELLARVPFALVDFAFAKRRYVVGNMQK